MLLRTLPLLWTLTGCATTRAPVAVLPLDVVGGTAGRVGAQIRRSVSRELARARPGTDVLADGRVDEAVRQSDGCARQRRGHTCALAAGRALGASEVVAGAVAGLGDTFVVQLQIVDVPRSTVTRSLEESFYGGAGDQAIRSISERLVDRPRPAPRTRRWYKSWWLWTAVGVAVAGVAVAVPLALRRDSVNYEPVPLP